MLHFSDVAVKLQRIQHLSQATSTLSGCLVVSRWFSWKDYSWHSACIHYLPCGKLHRSFWENRSLSSNPCRGINRRLMWFPLKKQMELCCRLCALTRCSTVNLKGLSRDLNAALRNQCAVWLTHHTGSKTHPYTAGCRSFLSLVVHLISSAGNDATYRTKHDTDNLV